MTIFFVLFDKKSSIGIKYLYKTDIDRVEKKEYYNSVNCDGERLSRPFQRAVGWCETAKRLDC